MQRLRNILVIGLMAVGVKAQAQDATPLRLVQTIPLPNVEGRIDHMAIDFKGQRLFIAALGNNTVEVLDLGAGKRIRSISGLHEPQGVGFIPAFNKMFVANGKGGGARTSLFVPELSRLYVAVPHRGGQSAEVRVFKAKP